MNTNGEDQNREARTHDFYSTQVKRDAASHEIAEGEGGGRVPFKSQAQRRKFAQLLVEGKISPDTFEEWNRETGRKRLPERVRTKAKTARKK